MSVLLLDSFDYYATTHLSGAGIWSGGGAQGTRITIGSFGRNSTQGIRVQATSGGSAGNGWVSNPITSGDVFAVGIGVINIGQAGGSGNIRLFGLFEGATAHMGLMCDGSDASTYNLYVVRGTTVLQTFTGVLLDSVYHYAELVTTIHDTTGAWEVFLDGVSLGSASSTDTRNGGTGVADTFVLGNRDGSTTNHDIRMDDLYVTDDAGGSPNNGRLGDVRVVALPPTGTGNYAQFTPSTGSNWQNVDEATPNDDTDYNSSTTAGDKDSFATTNLPSNAASVYAIKESLRHRKDDAGSATVRNLLRISSTDYESGDHAVADSYQYHSDIRETNPNTSNAWTQSDVDGMETGYKRQA